MQVSIVITYYDPESKKLKMLTDLLVSIGQHTIGKPEIIVVHNANSYVEAINTGLRQAKGDYVIVMNDDIIIKDYQWIPKLCQEGITGWRIGPHAVGYLPDAGCWSIDRKTLEKIGLMDEAYKNGSGYEDTDYFLRAKELKIPLNDGQVNLLHLEGQTLKTYYSETKKERERINREIFKKKFPGLL